MLITYTVQRYRCREIRTSEWENSSIINVEMVDFTALISSVRAPMQNFTDYGSHFSMILYIQTILFGSTISFPKFFKKDCPKMLQNTRTLCF